MSDLQEVRAVGAASYEDCKEVYEFMISSVRASLERTAPGLEGHATVKGLFLRAAYWMHSLGKLSEPSDFQAVLAGTRSLYEGAVDLVLLASDRQSYPIGMMLAWEESAKLRAAERVQKRFAGGVLPPRHQPRIDFINANGPRVLALRARYWPPRSHSGVPAASPKHPQRWTGRAQIEHDAVQADKLAQRELATFYDERFAELCWGTHGSSLVGARLRYELFPALMVQAFLESARFAMIISEFSLRYFDLFDDPIMQARFRQMNEHRAENRRNVYAAVREMKWPVT